VERRYSKRFEFLTFLLYGRSLTLGLSDSRRASSRSPFGDMTPREKQSGKHRRVRLQAKVVPIRPDYGLDGRNQDI
jgi:hypothetical protein